MNGRFNWVLESLQLSGASPAWFDGIRAGIALGVPLLLAVLTGQPPEVVVAAVVAAMLTGMTPGTTWLTREVWGLTTSIIAGALLVLLAALCSRNIWLAIGLMTLVALLSGFIIILGPAGRLLAAFLPQVVLLVLSSGPVPSDTLLPMVGAAVLGGLWATVVVVASRILRKRHPAREALVEMLAATTDFAQVVIRQRTSGSADDGLEAQFARERSSVGITAAIQVTERPLWLLPVNQRRWRAARRTIAEAYAQHIRLVGLHELPRSEVGSDRVVVSAEQIADELALALEHLNEDFASGAPGSKVEARPHTETASPQNDRAQMLAQLLSDELVQGLNESEGLATQSRALLRSRSLVTRYAFRFAIVVACSGLLGQLFPSPYGWWIVLTVTVVIKPELATTMAAIPPRILGTLAGGVVAGLLVILLAPFPWLTALISAVVFALAMAYRLVNYAIWTFGITLLVLIVLSMGTDSGWGPVGWRIGLTLLGAVLVWVAVVVLWPTRISQEVPRYVRSISRQIGALMQQVGGDNDGTDRVWRRARSIELEHGIATSMLINARTDPTAWRLPISHWGAQLSAERRLSVDVMAWWLVCRVDGEDRPDEPRPKVAESTTAADARCMTVLGQRLERAQHSAVPASIAGESAAVARIRAQVGDLLGEFADVAAERD